MQVTRMQWIHACVDFFLTLSNRNSLHIVHLFMRLNHHDSRISCALVKHVFFTIVRSATHGSNESTSKTWTANACNVMWSGFERMAGCWQAIFLKRNISNYYSNSHTVMITAENAFADKLFIHHIHIVVLTCLLKQTMSRWQESSRMLDLSAPAVLLVLMSTLVCKAASVKWQMIVWLIAYSVAEQVWCWQLCR